MARDRRISNAAQEYKEQIKRESRLSMTGKRPISSVAKDKIEFKFSSEEEDESSSESDQSNSESEEERKRTASLVVSGAIGNPDPVEKSDFHEMDSTVILLKKSKGKNIKDGRSQVKHNIRYAKDSKVIKIQFQTVFSQDEEPVFISFAKKIKTV